MDATEPVVATTAVVPFPMFLGTSVVLFVFTVEMVPLVGLPYGVEVE